MTMSVESVATHTTAPVPSASSQAMSARYVSPGIPTFFSCQLIRASTWRMQSLFSHGKLPLVEMTHAQLTATQHCIFDWLKQESSLEKCPMCRQRKSILHCLRCPKTLLISRHSIQVKESRRANRHRDAQTDTGTGYKSPVIFELACYRRILYE